MVSEYYWVVTLGNHPLYNALILTPLRRTKRMSLVPLCQRQLSGSTSCLYRGCAPCGGGAMMLQLSPEVLVTYPGFIQLSERAPSPVSLYLYTDTPCFTHMNPRVHTIELVLPRLIYSPILSKIITTADIFICNHMMLWTAMWPSIAYNTILRSLAAHPTS